MKTYNTYQEAKIANPESLICKFGDEFTTDVSRFGQALQPCNPANHCMTVEKFLADGYKFVKGDIALIHNGDVKVVENPNIDWNIPDSRDNERYILRAAALEEKPISVDEEPPRTKVEYEQVEFHKWHEAMFEHEINGPLYIKDENGFSDASMYEVVENWLSGLYRRIETPMTEREAFIEAAKELSYGGDMDSFLEVLFDKGCRFVN